MGDPVKVTITVRHRQGVSVNLPLQLQLDKFVELSREDAAREVGAKGEVPESPVIARDPLKQPG